MTGDRSQLINFVQKFLGTVKFRNDHVAKIMGYGDYKIGNVTISKVYFVEGLGHNLFSVGQLCDSDLEVAFCQHTCFIRNLDGVDLLTGSQGNNLYALSLKDMMASSPICLLSKASKTKSWLWHRHLSHLNFGAINHLARQGLVRGLPKLKFENDHLCSTCAMGKSKKKSHKTKSEDTNQEKIYLLHMDLYGPMRVESVNGTKYILVIVDDYSRFTWIKCLRSKDEAPDFIIKFLKMIQVRLKVSVCRIQTDNGTEFVNRTLHECYEQVGVSHETSIARSPQQNVVVERQESTCLLETTFVEDVVLMGVFPDEGLCSVNIIILLLFTGVTTISLVPKSLMPRQDLLWNDIVLGNYQHLASEPREKVDTSKAFDASLVNTESSGTEFGKQDTRSNSWNDVDADDADIKPVYDEEPMGEVQLTAEINVLATRQQHIEQPEFNNEGEVDQNAEQFLNKRQQSQILKEKSNEAKVKYDIDVSETINIELEHKVAKSLKKNESLKKNYKELFDSIKIMRAKTTAHTTSLIATNDKFKAQLQEKRISKPRYDSQVDVNNDLSKPATTHYLPKEREATSVKPHHMIASSNSRISSKNMPRFTSNDMVYNHYLEEAKKRTQERSRNSEPSLISSARLQSTDNVVRQPIAFKSERPRISKPWFASQVDVNNDLSKPVTTHYFLKERESASAKPHHVIASSNSRNSSKNMPRFSPNDMVHNHYLEKAKKKTQECGRSSKPSVMPSARSQSTTIGIKPKPRINNQESRNWPASKSSCVTTKTVPIAEHSRNSRNFFDSKHFVCSTCQKCVFNTNHDHCLTKFLNEVNSRAKVPSNKTTNRNKPVEQTSFEKKPERQIIKGHKFSIKKTSVVHEKTMTHRSCLRWKPTGKIFKTVDLR
nr:retrovirus-related Pol polyprotein from transposon TNT 1-94 [Tanacetum cinerariifolium]